MKNFSFNRFMWWFWIYAIRAGGLFFLLSPVKLPSREKQKLYDAAAQTDILIVFNPGGWGDATLERSGDFTPILNGMQQTLTSMGYRTGIVQYSRTLLSLAGRASGTREQILSFKNNARLQAQDLSFILDTYPDKIIILAGFSTGGGLTGRTLKSLTRYDNLYGIMVGVPGWFPVHYSTRTLVLDNNGLDPVSSGRVGTIAITVFRAPIVWLISKIKGRNLSLALALEMPDHDYRWDSEKVGLPIINFLQARFAAREKNRG